jgi:DNA-binding ferritin-like protein
MANAFAFIKTTNIHWHVSGQHFRDYHMLFEEQAIKILAMTDGVDPRVRPVELRDDTSASLHECDRLKVSAMSTRMQRVSIHSTTSSTRWKSVRDFPTNQTKRRADAAVED